MLSKSWYYYSCKVTLLVFFFYSLAVFAFWIFNQCKTVVFYDSMVSFFKKIWCFNLKELQPLQVCLVTNPSKCLLVLLPIIFWCNTNDAFWYSEQIDQTKIRLHFPLEFPEEFRNKKYSYVPHTMNVDDDQVFWFFEEPLKTFLNFFFVVELTFNKGKPRGSRHMFSQSHLACFLGGLFLLWPNEKL